MFVIKKLAFRLLSRDKASRACNLIGVFSVLFYFFESELRAW